MMWCAALLDSFSAVPHMQPLCQVCTGYCWLCTTAKLVFPPLAMSYGEARKSAQTAAHVRSNDPWRFAP